MTLLGRLSLVRLPAESRSRRREDSALLALHPLARDLPHLAQTFEQIGIEGLLPIGPVEVLDEGVLIGLARLDFLDHNPVLLAPAYENLVDQLRPVVAADRVPLIQVDLAGEALAVQSSS